MKTKTIIFWGSDDILSYSVKYFLTTENEWHLLTISPEENLDGMIQAVNRIKPEVVVIHQENYIGNDKLPIMLLQKHPGLKVIVFSSGNTMMEVYNKQDVLVESASDLISVVKADLTKIAGREKQYSSIIERR